MKKREKFFCSVSQEVEVRLHPFCILNISFPSAIKLIQTVDLQNWILLAKVWKRVNEIFFNKV